ERAETDLSDTGEIDEVLGNTVEAEGEAGLTVEGRRHMAKVLNSLLEREPDELAALLNQKRSFEKREKRGYNPTPEQWRKIESVFHEAIEFDSNKRATFLDE